MGKESETPPKETELTPEVLAAADPAYWAHINRIKLQAGSFSFKNREYQFEPMQSQARRKCYRKGTQQGVTEFETILNTLHGMIYRRYKRGVLVLFPTMDNVLDFSKSRFDPIIAANKQAVGKYVKMGGVGTDTASLKKINGSLLYLRGARLSQNIGKYSEVKESVQLRSAPVDCVKFEEMDLIDDDVLTKAKMRMGDSEMGEEVYISNPTIPDFGIDAIFQKSDQRYWFKQCSCREWTSPEKTFPECVAIRKDRTGYIKCSKCGKDIGPFSGCKGEWVPAVRENTDYMHGWHLSHLMSRARINDPAEVLEDFNNPPQGNLADVYRLRLGLPYVAAEDKLSPDVVRQCCGQDTISTHFNLGQCAMGVDVGKVKHVIIGIKTGLETYELLKMAQLSDWNDIHDLARRFNVKSAVVDIRPYEDAARLFQKEEPYRIFLCEYSENTVIGTTYNDNSGVVKVNRTEIFDATHRMIVNQNVRLPRMGGEMDVFVKQLCNSAKVLETNKRTGTAIYRYRTVGSGGDHYRNALNYFYLAADGCRITRSHGTIQPRQAYAINDGVRL